MKKIVKIKMTPYEVCKSIILFCIAIIIFMSVMWFGGTLVGCDGISSNVYLGKYKPMIVVSGSMSPTIEVNGLVAIESQDFDTINIGEIILFNTKAYGLVCHRIVEKGYDENIGVCYMTKGDHNNNRDKWIVTKDMYNGTVVEIHNEVSGIVTFLFGDLNNINMARLMFGFMIIFVCIIGVIGLFILIYQYVCIYAFLRKSSKLGGKNVVEEYYSFVSNESIKSKLIELYDEFGKKDKLKHRLVLKFKIMRLHKALIKQERTKQKAKELYKEFREDVKKYGI